MVGFYVFVCAVYFICVVCVLICMCVLCMYVHGVVCICMSVGSSFAVYLILYVVLCLFRTQ